MNADYYRLRRCVALTKVGTRCRNFATWGDPQRLCGSHGYHWSGSLPPRGGDPPPRRRGTPMCTGVHCPWARPHRPGSCAWPNVEGVDDPYEVLIGGAVDKI